MYVTKLILYKTYFLKEKKQISKFIKTGTKYVYNWFGVEKD